MNADNENEAQDADSGSEEKINSLLSIFYDICYTGL